MKQRWWRVLAPSCPSVVAFSSPHHLPWPQQPVLLSCSETSSGFRQSCLSSLPFLFSSKIISWVHLGEWLWCREHLAKCDHATNPLDAITTAFKDQTCCPHCKSASLQKSSISQTMLSPIQPSYDSLEQGWCMRSQALVARAS